MSRREWLACAGAALGLLAARSAPAWLTTLDGWPALAAQEPATARHGEPKRVDEAVGIAGGLESPDEGPRFDSPPESAITFGRNTERYDAKSPATNYSRTGNSERVDANPQKCT